MIKANMAKEMAKEFHKKAEEARIAKIRKFLDNECDSAVNTAAINGQYSCFVEVPEELHEQTATITAMLYTEGYFAQTRHGNNVAILIKWDK